MSDLGGNLFFKYLGIKTGPGKPTIALDFLDNELFRFTQPDKLNDPLEARPRLYLDEYAPEDYEHARRKAAESEFLNPSKSDLETFFLDPCPRGRYGDTPGSFPAHIPELRPEPFSSMADLDKFEAQKVFDELLAAVNRTYGVFSMTTDPVNLPMWAHYGANHTGCVVGFDRAHPFFCSDKLLFRVEYRAEQIAISSKHGWIRYGGVPWEKTDVVPLPTLLRKLPKWNYESEWRLIKALADRANDLTAAEPPEVCLFRIPSDAVRCVILGNRMSSEDKLRIESRLIADKRWQHVHALTTSIDDRVGELRVVPMALNRNPQAATSPPESAATGSGT